MSELLKSFGILLKDIYLKHMAASSIPEALNKKRSLFFLIHVHCLLDRWGG